MVGPTTQGMERSDRHAIRAPTGTTRPTRSSAACTRARASSRSRCSIPSTTTTGKQNGRNASLKFVNYLGFFIEEMQGNEVIGRITPIGGLRKGTGYGPAPAAAFPKVDSAGSVGIHGTTRGLDHQPRRRIQARRWRALLRACGVPVGIVEERRPAKRRCPTSSSSTSAPTPRRGWRRSSGCAPRTRRWRSSRSPRPPSPT